MSDDSASPLDVQLGAVAREAESAGAVAYLVGGAVRDRFLGRTPSDADVALQGGAGVAASVVVGLAARGWTAGPRHDRFGTATLRAPGGERVDLAVTREESYPQPGSLPEVRCGVPIERDLARRDFSIHAMALRLGRGGAEGEVLDPFGGRADLSLRRVRLLHAGSLADDPTRAFRAARYAARLGFELDAGFGEAVRRSVKVGAFARTSGDRLRRALGEVLSEENRGVAMAHLERLGVLDAVVPGWTLDGRVLGDLAATGDPEDSLARVLAPLGPELRGAVARRLGFSRALRRRTGCPP